MSEPLPVREQLHSFIDDLERCLEYRYGKDIECSNIVLCGMGGSAISGNVVADYCLKHSRIPVITVMNCCLPNWVGKDSLVVISSYSGNTLETLNAYRQALAAGCKRIVITAGGILEKAARKNSDPLVMLPDNLHPRHSIGYMIGYIYGIIRSAGAVDEPGDILSLTNSLKDYRDSLEKEGNDAERIARQFIDHIPVICSYSRIQSVVFRWKTQFNENSKYVAFCGTLSDFAYSDMKGWINGRRPNYKLTLIADDDNSLTNDVYLSKMIGYLNDHDVKYGCITLGGRNEVENMFRALMLGDYVSMYMAEIQDIDPSSVPPITLLKTKLKPMIDDVSKELLSSTDGT